MDTSSFLDAVKKTQTIDLAANTINIISADFESKYIIDDHVTQQSRHHVIESFYTDPKLFDRTGKFPVCIQKLFPKMLNWRYVQADYYIWVNPEYKIIAPNTIDWLVHHLNSSNRSYAFFRDNTRTISEEVERIRELGETSEFDIIEVNKHIARITRDYEYTGKMSLFDPSIFIYKSDAVRFDLNFMESWFHNTVTGCMHEKLSLIHTMVMFNPLFTSIEVDDDQKFKFFEKR